MLVYTGIQHVFRREHKLTNNEYVLCDMVYHLSNNKNKMGGWCYASKETLAKDFGISRQAISGLIAKMIEEGFLTKHEETKHLQTTAKWDNVYLCKESLHTDNKVANSSKESLHQNEIECKESLHTGCKESLHNNNTLNNNKESYNNKDKELENSISTIPIYLPVKNNSRSVETKIAPAAIEWQARPIVEIIEELKNDQHLVAVSCMSHKIAPEKMLMWMDKFCIYKENKDGETGTYKDVRSHLANWLTKQDLKTNPNGTDKNTNGGRYSGFGLLRNDLDDIIQESVRNNPI